MRRSSGCAVAYPLAAEGIGDFLDLSASQVGDLIVVRCHHRTAFRTQDAVFGFKRFLLFKERLPTDAVRTKATFPFSFR
jgi:hypothetical protein